MCACQISGNIPCVVTLLRVALVNDYELVLKGLALVLRPYPEVTGVELDVDCLPSTTVDVALFDAYGRSDGGLERVRMLMRSPHVRNVALYAWTLTPEQRDAALACGVGGVLSKSITGDELVDALRRIAAGERVVSEMFEAPDEGSWPGRELGLTCRESEVAALLRDGLRNREIARALYVSENTVKSHLKAIFMKLDAASRGEAIVRLAGVGSFARRVA
jgi:DNA-binding NarL/FixJ family response regulator